MITMQLSLMIRTTSLLSGNIALRTIMQSFQWLDHLHHTTEGLDKLPAWFLRLTAPIYSAILADLINLSVLASYVPAQWKTAIIIPIPKFAAPASPAYYRPLSIQPVLSKRVEKEIVCSFLYPTFLNS